MWFGLAALVLGLKSGSSSLSSKSTRLDPLVLLRALVSELKAFGWVYIGPSYYTNLGNFEGVGIFFSICTKSLKRTD